MAFVRRRPREQIHPLDAPISGHADISPCQPIHFAPLTVHTHSHISILSDGAKTGFVKFAQWKFQQSAKFKYKGAKREND